MATGDDKELQRYFDGELSQRRARKVRARVEANAEDRGRLTALSAMREAVRDASSRSSEAADFGNLWAGVQQGIARQQPLPLGERLRIWTRRWGAVLAAGVATAAVAAALVLRPVALPPPRNDAVIESLDVGAEAVSTIFTISDDVGGSGETTVIWVTETSAEGEL